MDKDFRLSRHSQLWEEKNKAIKRTAVAGLFFAAFVLINVLQPHSKQQELSAPIRAEIEKEIKKLGDDKVETDSALASLSDLQGKLDLFKQALQDNPGEDQKNKLIKTFRELNAKDEFDRNLFQEKADQTILAIENEVLQLLAPVTELLTAKPALIKRLSYVKKALDDLSMSLSQWKKSKLGKVWYSTIEGKNRAILQLNQDLQRVFADVPQEVEQALVQLNDAIKVNKRSLTVELEKLEQQGVQKQSALKDLNAKMQQIMPEWLRGLIKVEQMVQIYPLIMMGLVLYIVGNGFSLTRHYKVIAQERAWSNEEASDPAYSSLWTMSYRGRTATIVTTLTYLCIIIAFWFFYEQGSDLYFQSRIAGNEEMAVASHLATPAWIWIERLLFTAAVILVTLWPWRKLTSQRT
jgi:hypothetical protein